MNRPTGLNLVIQLAGLASIAACSTIGVINDRKYTALPSEVHQALWLRQELAELVTVGDVIARPGYAAYQRKKEAMDTLLGNNETLAGVRSASAYSLNVLYCALASIPAAMLLFVRVPRRDSHSGGPSS